MNFDQSIDLNQLLTTIVGVLTAIGIWEAVKRLILSRVDENIENRKLDNQTKRKIREDIYNFVALGQATLYQESPPSQDLANIYKIIYQLNLYKKKQLATELENFVFNWQFQIYVKPHKIGKLEIKAEEETRDLGQSIIEKINKTL